MVMKTHEQYFVGVRFRYDLDDPKRDGIWRNALCWMPERKSLETRYVKTLDDAKKVLANAYKVWNGTKVYNENGERITTQEIANGIGVSMIHTRESDRENEIVEHIIQKRLVTDWETVEDK